MVWRPAWRTGRLTGWNARTADRLRCRKRPQAGRPQRQTPSSREMETPPRRPTLPAPGLALKSEYRCPFRSAFSDRLRIASSEQMSETKVSGLAVLLLVLASCSDPPVLTATVSASATQSAVLGGRAQLVVNVTNTGPAIPHLGLVFMTADKWYEEHLVTDLAGCTLAADSSAFD